MHAGDYKRPTQRFSERFSERFTQILKVHRAADSLHLQMGHRDLRYTEQLTPCTSHTDGAQRLKVHRGTGCQSA